MTTSGAMCRSLKWVLSATIVLVCACEAANAASDVADAVMRQDAPTGGGAFAGVVQVFRSPYLLGICTYMLLFTTLSTVLYFQQAWIVEAEIEDRVERTQFFAAFNMAVNVITLAVQTLATGRIIKWLGLAVALTILPALTVAGFVFVGLMPTMAVIVGFHVLRRAGEFALARPAREVLFTTVSREEKYKAKSLIDTFVYRGGDATSGSVHAFFTGTLGFTSAGIGWVGAVFSFLWAIVAYSLGKAHENVKDSRATAAAPAAAGGEVASASAHKA
jgi:AAA family ATP:ADP antiporter